MSEEKKQKMRCICSGKSAVDPVDIPASAEELSHELARRNVQKATAILWQVNEIRCGTWEHGTFSFPDETPLNAKLLIELRIFNETSELHLRRERAQLVGRFRIDDEEGEAAEYVDTLARFWGSRSDAEREQEQHSAWMTLRDPERKLELTLPKMEDSTENPVYVGLVTRSYIGIHTTGQAGYVDHRYCRIAAADMEGETNG